MMKNHSLYSFSRDDQQLLLMLIGLSAMSLIVWLFDNTVAQENNLLEISQSALLIVAGLLHLHQLSATSQGNIEHYVRIGLMILCVGILLRETDIDRFGNSVIWSRIELLLRGVTFVCALVYIYMLTRRAHWLQVNLKIIPRLSMIRIAGLGGIFYLTGWFFDNSIFPLSTENNLFIEELLELNATALFTVSATKKLSSHSVYSCGN